MFGGAADCLRNVFDTWRAVEGGYAYCHSVDAFAWGVIGSVAGVVGAAAAILFGLLPLLRERRKRKEIPQVPDPEGGASGRDAKMPIIFGEIPAECSAFSDRRNFQDALLHSSTESPNIYVITGIRGVGKTQLAAYVARQRIVEGWRLVAWISAEDDDQLIDQLALLGKELGIEGDDTQPRIRAIAVRHWLETDGNRCLIVLDNANNPDSIRPFLPVTGAAHVMITSFRQTLGVLGKTLTVEVFASDQAVEFLMKRTGRKDAGEASAVAFDLGFLPLALAHAAAVMSGQRIGYDVYRERLNSTDTAVYLIRPEGEQYPLGVAEAITLSVSAVESQVHGAVCRQIIVFASVLSPTGISRKFLNAAAALRISPQLPGLFPKDDVQPLATDVDVDAALQDLANASLINWSEDGQTIFVHRLVSRIVRERAAGDGTLSAAVSRAIDSLHLATSRKIKDEGLIFPKIPSEYLVPHISALRDNAAKYDGLLDSKHAALILSLELYAIGYRHGIRHGKAKALAEHGRFEEAITILESLEADLENVDIGKKQLNKIKEDLKDIRDRHQQQKNENRPGLTSE